MAGIYTRVTVEVQAEAEAGSRVPVRIKFDNISAGSLNVLITAYVSANGDQYLNLPGDPIYLRKGEGLIWNGSFTMPGQGVSVTGEIFFELMPGEWELDDTDTKWVALALPPVLKYIALTVLPSTAYGYVTSDPTPETAEANRIYYNEGEIVTLTAHPYSGYEFVSWSGDVSGTSPSISIFMDRDKTVYVNLQVAPLAEPEFRGFRVAEYTRS